MPMSEYMRGLREKVGTAVIEIPTVSVLIFEHFRRQRAIETGTDPIPRPVLPP